MRDVKIYDGSVWRSLKGPTAVSANAGNIVRLGTDGLLYSPSIVEAGVWTPDAFWPEGVDGYEVLSANGNYVKVGPLVHVAAVITTTADDLTTLPMSIEGLPYPMRRGAAVYQYGTAASAPSFPEYAITASLFATPGGTGFNVVRWMEAQLSSFTPDNRDIGFQATYMTD